MQAQGSYSAPSWWAQRTCSQFHLGAPGKVSQSWSPFSGFWKRRSVQGADLGQSVLSLSKAAWDERLQWEVTGSAIGVGEVLLGHSGRAPGAGQGCSALLLGDCG